MLLFRKHTFKKKINKIMQIKYSLLLVFFSLFFFSACEEEELYITIAKEAEIFCEDQPSEYFFEGFINGEKICFQEGIDYYMQFSKWSGFTSGATIDLEQNNGVGTAWAGFTFCPRVEESGPRKDKFPFGAQHIEIWSPEFSIETSKKEILNELIQNQEFTILEEEEREEGELSSTYNFRWLIAGDEDNDGHHGLIQSSGGPQPNAYLRMTELETEEFNDRIFYTMTLEMACDLYIGSAGKIHYGRLEDGKMRLAFFVDKE